MISAEALVVVIVSMLYLSIWIIIWITAMKENITISQLQKSNFLRDKRNIFI